MGGIVSGLIGASSARSASRAQERAANNQLALETRVYDESVERFEPYAQSGQNYLQALNFELLGGERPVFGGNPMSITEEQYQTGPGSPIYQRGGDESDNFKGYGSPQMGTRYSVNGQNFDTRDAAQAYADANSSGGYEYGGYQATPGYQFALDAGLSAVENSAAARGGLYSGAAMKALQERGQGIQNQDYGNFLNRLTSGAAGGQSAAALQANAGANYAQGAGQAYGNIGNAQAAGAIGVGNALQSGIGNQLGLWNYQNQQGGGTATGLSGLGSLFGGSWNLT